jgi:hypothetical protein
MREVSALKKWFDSANAEKVNLHMPDVDDDDGSDWGNTAVVSNKSVIESIETHGGPL